MNTYKVTLINLGVKCLDFYGFKWVLKTIDTKSYFAYSVIKIEKDLVIGTDGHRLHIFYPKELYLSGTYKVLVKTRTQIVLEKVYGIDYPEWHFALKFKKPLPLEMRLTRIDSTGYTELVRQMNVDETLNFNYFSDLDSDMTKAFLPTDPKEGVIFENFDGRKKALIMPMRT